MKKQGSKKTSNGQGAGNAKSVANLKPDITPDSPPIASEDTEVTKNIFSKEWWQRHWKLAALATGGFLLLLAIIWLVGNIFFSKITLGNTTLAGRKSDKALQQFVANKAANYRLNLKYPDGHTESFALPAMGMQVDSKATVVTIRKAQQGFIQRLAWWRPVKASLSIKVDNAVQNAFIAQHVQTVLQPAQNAALSIEGGAVKISPPADGQQISLYNADKALLTTATQLQDVTLVPKAIVLKPSVTEATLAAPKVQLEAVINQHVAVTIGEQAVTPSAAEIASWLNLTPTATGVDISVNGEAVNNYLSGLAYSHSKSPTSQVVSETNGQVIKAGSKGVSVGGTQAAAGTIKQELLKGAGVQVALPVSYTPFTTVSASSAGKWIDVNLSTKRMYAYSQGEVVRTFLISAGAPGTPTPTGRFAIYSKLVSQDMYGPNLDGTSYYQPDVPYVNYFTGAYAIHGNYWRPSSYFGNVHSSHGCVGIPVGDSAWLYSWAPIGTTVVVHY